MRATVFTLFTLIGLLVLGAAPASAGGPTSVLLSAPGNQRVAAIYHTDAAYHRLANTLDGGAAAPADESGPYVTATWLIHDVQVWRTDRIYLTSAGPVIETRTTGGTERGIWESPASWHTSSSPKELLAILDTLGLTTPSATAAVTEQVATTPAAPEPVVDVRWEWGIGGLLAGALLAVAGMRVLPHLRRPSLSLPRPVPPLR